MLIRKLKTRYKIGLGLIALVAIFFQLIIQWQLSAKKDDSYIIDVAGRQRMFSQRITKDILALEPNRLSNLNNNRKDLSESLSEFKKVQQSLVSRSVGKFKGSNTKEIQEFYAQITPYFDELTSTAECYAKNKGNCVAQSASLMENESNFLKIMNSIVASYSLNLEKSIVRIRAIEFFLLALILAILIFEAVYIFRPAIKLVETSIESVERQKEITEKNFKLATVGEISAELAHEIKNPLFVIKGKCELLLMKLKSGELDNKDTCNQVEQILASVDRTNDVIFGLLNASRNQEDFTSEPFDLVKCIHENLAFTKHLARENDVTVHTTIPSGKILALGNPSHLSQVLLNIISNALYEAKSSKEKKIVVEIDSDSDFICIKIKNSGSRIKKELHEKIFTPFFTTKASDQGNGLGLSVSKNLIKKMKGDLFLDSSGELTTFVVKIKKA